MIQGTSLLAYTEILGSIGKRQMEVYKIIEQHGSINNTMIAQELSLPISSITPRTGELVKKGLVTETYKGKCPITKRLTIFWGVKHKLK